MQGRKYFHPEKIENPIKAIENPKMYFKDVAYLGSRIICRSCNQETFFTNANRFRLDKGAAYQWGYQCQDCGIQEMSAYGTACVDYMDKRCNCGGQFRRDKPLYCGHCYANKTEENRSETMVE